MESFATFQAEVSYRHGLAMRVQGAYKLVKHWYRLLTEVGDSISLETFMARLDEDLSHLIKLKMSLVTAGRLE